MSWFRRPVSDRAAKAPAMALLLVAICAGLAALAGACDDPECSGSASCAADAGTDAATPVDGGSDAGPADAGSLGCAHLPGLYVTGSCSMLAAGVERFAPQFPLWSDGAAKERFYLLPSGTTIDASDPDAWVFPVGTVFWKHFLVDGERVETRMLRKTAPTGASGASPTWWEMRTFLWNAAGDDVTEVTSGQQNVRGTMHDLPAAPGDCLQCHRTKDAILGFSAIQLNWSDPGNASANLLVYLETANLLSGLPADAGTTLAARAVVPGGSTSARAALGYLHANCGHCHLNFVGGRASACAPGMQFFLPVGLSSVESTPTYVSAVNVTATLPDFGAYVLHGGDSDDSAIHNRMNALVPPNAALDRMPPLATEKIDVAGLAAIDAWIADLPVP